jgi:hypothetical protein
VCEKLSEPVPVPRFFVQGEDESMPETEYGQFQKFGAIADFFGIALPTSANTKNVTRTSHSSASDADVLSMPEGEQVRANLAAVISTEPAQELQKNEPQTLQSNTRKKILRMNSYGGDFDRVANEGPYGK